MDDVFETPPTKYELTHWGLDMSLLPGDEPLSVDDADPVETPVPPPGEEPPTAEEPLLPGEIDPVLLPSQPDPGLVSDSPHGDPLRRLPEYTYVHGRRACSCFAKIVSIVEKRLVEIGAIQHDLSGLITQQSYNGTAVKASAGTHAGGGVWDVKWSLVNSDAKKRAWFAAGIIPFERITSDAPKSRWPNHGHVVVAGCPHRTESAAEQEKAARLGRNALKNNDDFRGVCGPIITWRAAVDAQNTASAQAASAMIQIQEIPRHRTPKPWPVIVEDGDLGSQTMDRLRRQLDLALTDSASWSHWDVAALLVWLGEPCGDKAVITTLAILKLQHRVGTTADGRWGDVTTLAVQKFLNKNR